MPDLSGRSLANGKYVIQSSLGKGGMATVYLALQSAMNRDVAIKIMRQDLTESPDFVERFKREMKALTVLQHPFILKVFDYGQEDDIVYLVMDYMPGGTLSDLIARQGVLEHALISGVLHNIGSALDFAHSKGFVHRDLKPHNILLDESGNAYLTDFGIAKMMTESSDLTKTNTTMGSPIYMSPEQWRGEGIESRSDIYSLGVVLYEMLTGTHPFDGDTPHVLMTKHMMDAPKRLHGLRPDLPVDMQQVLDKALAKQTRDRFANAKELAAAYEAAMSRPYASVPIPASTPPAGIPYRGMNQDTDYLKAANNDAGMTDLMKTPPPPPVIGAVPLVPPSPQSASRLNPLFLVLGMVGFLVLVGVGAAFVLIPKMLSANSTPTTIPPTAVTVVAAVPSPLPATPVLVIIPSPTAPLPSATALPPTPTPIPPTVTNPPTVTPYPPTNTVFPTATANPPTPTPIPATNTAIPPSATLIPPTVTNVPPTKTSIPPTATPRPPTNTSLPPSVTPRPATSTPTLIPTSTVALTAVALLPDTINMNTLSRLTKTAALADYVGLKVGNATFNTDNGGDNRIIFFVEGEARVWNVQKNVVELACIGTQAIFLSSGTGDPILLVLNPASAGVLNLEICDTQRVTPVTNSVRSPVTAFTFDAAHGRIATAHQDGLIRLWKISNRALEEKPTCQFVANLGGIATLSFDRDGRLLAGTSSRLLRQVNVWDANACKPSASFTLSATITSIAVNSTANQVFVGQENGTISIIDLDVGKTSATLKGGTQAVSALAFAPIGNSLFSANLDKTLILWGEDGKPNTLELGNALVSLSFSPDGKRAIFVLNTGEVQLWGVS